MKTVLIGGMVVALTMLGSVEAATALPVTPARVLAVEGAPSLLLLARHHRHHHHGRWARYRMRREEPPETSTGATMPPGYSSEAMTNPRPLQGGSRTSASGKPTIQWVDPDKPAR
jgi:hypothetical protein